MASKLKFECAVAALVAGAMPFAAAAQTQTPVPAPAPTPAPTPRAKTQKQTPAPAPPAASEDEEGEIVVRGELRGAVTGDIQPEQSLAPADIRAYGVSSISDLLAQLAPQTYSGRGRGGEMPVVLLNGRRISSFAEIRDLPTEAIERVDILPEEVALKYGYQADQRVVNVVLRQRFRALTTELGGSMPTQGGNTGRKASVDMLKISRDKRMNVDVQYQSNSNILESERDIIPSTVPLVPGGSAPDFGEYRTLVSPSQALTMTGTYSRNLSTRVSLSVNTRLELNQRQSLLGPPTLGLVLPAGNPFSTSAGDVNLLLYEGGGPLWRSNNNRTLHGGFTLNGDAKPWRWSVTGNYDRVASDSITERGFNPLPLQARLDANDPSFNPFAPLDPLTLAARPADRANSLSNTGSLDAMANGPLFKLPAGDVTTTVRVTAGTSQFDSSSLRSGIAASGSVGRDSLDGQANIDIPITSRRAGVLSAIGDISLNGNVEVEHLSDFGTLTTTGYGARWAPVKALRFLVSVTDEEGAPSPQQLGNPTVVTPGVRVFDLVQGQTVDISTITGGNPLLGGDKRHVVKLGLNARPFEKLDFNFNVDYVRSTTRNQIASFPTATPELEAAFPGRFVRDSSGRLLSIDQRPTNFERADRSELHWGFNISIPVKSSIEKRVAEARAAFDKAREEAERDGKPTPDPRPFFQSLGPPGRPNLGNSIFGGPIFGQGGQGGRGQGQGQRQQGGAQPAAGQGQQPAAPAQGQQPPAGQQAGGPGGPAGPGGGGRGFGGRGGFGGFGGPNSPLSGRIQISLYHTWRFRDQVLIREPLPVLDFLNGSAQGSSGGEPRHEFDLQAGYTKNGIGLRFTGHWQTATDVDGGAAGATSSLHFSSLGTLGVRLFADLGQQIPLLRKHPWVLGTRISLGVDNIFDSRIKVTDPNGATPLGYQPDLLDPNGRTIRLTIRKLFL